MYNITKCCQVEQSVTSPFPAALKYNSEHIYHNLDPRRRVGNQTPTTSPFPVKPPIIPLTRLDAAQQPLEICASKQPTARPNHLHIPNPSPFPYTESSTSSHMFASLSYPYSDTHSPAPPLSTSFHQA